MRIYIAHGQKSDLPLVCANIQLTTLSASEAVSAIAVRSCESLDKSSCNRIREFRYIDSSSMLSRSIRTVPKSLNSLNLTEVTILFWVWRLRGGLSQPRCLEGSVRLKDSLGN